MARRARQVVLRTDHYPAFRRAACILVASTEAARASSRSTTFVGSGVSGATISSPSIFCRANSLILSRVALVQSAGSNPEVRLSINISAIATSLPRTSSSPSRLSKWASRISSGQYIVSSTRYIVAGP